ncbi:MAG: hypothetical protein PHQ36_08990 [Anaerolineales bacterium]|nr:hypothetical protein [Anaerolineales bacterium]
MFIMNNSLKLSEISVENILKSAPEAPRFFLDWRTNCVGCNFARFCSIQDVVNSYQFDEKKFLEAIQKLNVQKS